MLVLIFSNNLNEGIKQGINLCINNVIPSLYIFTFLSIFIVKCNLFDNLKICGIIAKLLNINKISASIYLLSLISGYPVGAKLINETYKQNVIDYKTSKNMLYYCINPSPAFIVSIVGIGIYNNEFFGLIILISSLMSSFITALFLRNKNSISTNFKTNIYIDYNKNLLDSIKETNFCMISICSWVILVNSVIFILCNSKYNFILPLLEVTCGVNIAKNYSVYYVAFIIGFGGIAVIMQVISMLKDIKIKCEIVLIKILNGILTALFTAVLLRIFPQSFSVANVHYTIKYTETSIYSSVIFIMFIIVSLFYLKNAIKKM